MALASLRLGGAAPVARSAIGLVTALRLADRLGVLMALHTPRRSAELATVVGADGRRMEALLRVLAAADVLSRDADGRYRARVSGADLRTTLASMGWAEETFCTDAAPAQPAAVTTDTAGYAEIVPALSRRLADSSALVAAQLGGPRVRLLDIGAGMSAVGRAIVARHPAARVTAVDRPEVLRRLRAALEQEQLLGAYTLLPLDAAREGFPGAHDVVLLAAFLHLFPPPTVRRILRRAAAATMPGGTLAVVDVLLAESLDGPLAAATYALDLTLRVPDGGIWPASQLSAWLAEAGTTDVRVQALPEPGLHLIVSSLPAAT